MTEKTDLELAVEGTTAGLQALAARVADVKSQAKLLISALEQLTEASSVLTDAAQRQEDALRAATSLPAEQRTELERNVATARDAALVGVQTEKAATALGELVFVLEGQKGAS